jgi:hypothetical protein
LALRITARSIWRASAVAIRRASSSCWSRLSWADWIDANKAMMPSGSNATVMMMSIFAPLEKRAITKGHPEPATSKDGYTPSGELAKKIDEFIGHVFTHRIFIGGLQRVRDVRFRSTGLLSARRFIAAAIPTFLIRDQAESPLIHFEPQGFGRFLMITLIPRKDAG